MSVFGLTQQAKSLAPQGGEEERNRWFIGSIGLKEDNTITLVDYDEESDEITYTSWDHPPEILNICPSANDPRRVITVHRSHDNISGPTKATMWNLSDFETYDDGKLRGQTGLSLDVVAEVSSEEAVTNVLYDPSGRDDKLLVQGNHFLAIHSVTDESIISTARKSFDSSSPHSIRGCAWSPHADGVVAMGLGRNLFGWDFRSSQSAFEFLASESFVSCVDFNPNKPYQVAVGGDDCTIRIWDTRQLSKPLLNIRRHTHSLTSVCYNRYHDQLILSTSTDCLVLLESIVSVSSEPIQSTSDQSAGDQSEYDEPLEKPEDGLVGTFDQHEESIYSVAWSNADPWIFASVSCDGRVVVNLVPSDHKYKIIL